MPLVPAKCTQCGSALTVEPSQDAAICPFCNTPFVIEKAINNYNTTNNISADVVNIYQSKETDFVIRGGVLEEYRGEGTEVYIPNGVVKINDYAFKDCVGITKVEIPASVKIIGKSIFSDCGSLESVLISGDLTVIEEGMFFRCASLKKVNIPVSVTKIAGAAFAGCTSLTSIHIPENVNEIEVAAFKNCENLKSIDIPVGVKTISKGVFAGCYNLEDITIPNTVEIIEEGAFKNCSSLRNVNIPKTIKKIAHNYYDTLYEFQCDAAFENCKNLKTINGKEDPFEDFLDLYIENCFYGAPINETFHKHNVWRMQERCRHCGGKFKGVLKYVCKNCGRPKDYKKYS